MVYIGSGTNLVINNTIFENNYSLNKAEGNLMIYSFTNTKIFNSNFTNNSVENGNAGALRLSLSSDI